MVNSYAGGWLYMLVYENRTSKMKLFGVKEFFRIKFYFQNGCKNEFKDNDEK